MSGIHECPQVTSSDEIEAQLRCLADIAQDAPDGWTLLNSPARELVRQASLVIAGLRGRELAAQATLARVRKVRDGYADQVKFADVDPASCFREFVRRLDAACLSSGQNLADANSKSPIQAREE